MKRIRRIYLIPASLILLVMPALATAQSDGAGEDAIGIAPTRFELPMMPGTERTVVVNVIYNSVSAEAEPCRLVAYLGDWTLLRNGDTEFYRAGSQPRTASSWLIYSPGEVTAIPGKVHPIRVTISVPEDATPGDHLAALFVESRPDNIKLDQNRRQVVLRFRMAALFYIMVPQLTRKGSLENLKAEARERAVIVTPTLKNTGNSRLRPFYSIRILDTAGSVVVDLSPRESLPVLGNSEISPPILIEKSLPPGSYSVHFRVDFKDGTALTEGQTDLIIKPR